LSTGEEEVAISKAAIVKINKAAPASMKAAWSSRKPGGNRRESDAWRRGSQSAMATSWQPGVAISVAASAGYQRKQ
jgi:hypothetical protein